MILNVVHNTVLRTVFEGEDGDVNGPLHVSYSVVPAVRGSPRMSAAGSPHCRFCQACLGELQTRPFCAKSVVVLANFVARAEQMINVPCRE